MENTTGTNKKPEKNVIVKVDYDTHRALKQKAFENDTTIKAIVMDLILEYLNK